MADTVKVKVVGSCQVGSIQPGGTGELDPNEVNVPALVAGGHVEVVTSKAKSAGSKDDKAGGS